MAYQIKYIPPDDLKPNQKIGLKYPMVGENGLLFSSNSVTLDQIKTDLIMLLLTTKGERYMLPDYGTNVKRVLFETDENNIIDILDEEIHEAVTKWLPIVIINNIDVRRDTVDEHLFYVKIQYTTRLDTNQSEQIIISLNPNTVVTM